MMNAGDDLRLWRVRSSELEGFSRNYSTETPDGDIIAVDFNFAREMVRISVNLAQENGREYISLIKSGTILQEREISGKRSIDLTSRIHPFYQYFYKLQDEVILRCIGGNYGLPLEPEFSHAPAYRRNQPVLELRKRFRPITWIREYLREKRKEEQRERPFYLRLMRRLPAEIRDLSLGILIYYLYARGLLNMTELAGYLGTVAIMSGAWDWIWRQRDPFLPKVLALMIASGFVVYQQVQYRMWAIFL